MRRWAWGLSVVVGFVQPPALVSELEATQRRAGDKLASLREREQAADKAMELRARVIEAAEAGDERLPGWLLDSAAGELARLGRDGSDTAVLFGIPLPAQRDAVQQGAEQAVRLLDRAASAIRARATALADAPAEDPAKAHVEQERTVRIPFFAARAHVLLAACATGKERSRQAQTAFDAVGKLALSSVGPEGLRRVCVGAALLMRATPAPEADLQSAVEEFGWVLTATGAGITATTRAEAWFGLIAAGAAMGKLEEVLEQVRPALAKEPFVGPDGRADSLLAVLAADAMTRAWFEQGLKTGDRSMLDQAVAAQQTLLRRQDLTVRAESLRPLAFQKLHLVGQGARPGLDLPPAMDLAGAIDAARDSARRDEAIRRLAAVAESPDAGDFAADALWELAVLRLQGSPPAAERDAATWALVRLAKDHATNPRAPEAMVAALSHAQALSRGRETAGADQLYREALTVAVSGFPSLNGIDVWRYEYARVLADRDEVPMADLRSAQGALWEVGDGVSISADARRLLERIQARLLDEAWERVDAARRAGEAEKVQEICRSEIVPEARRAVAWAAQKSVPSLDRFRADLADGLTECWDSGGRALYQELLRRSPTVPGGKPRLNLGLARSLMISGDTRNAFSILRDLATTLDTPAEGAPANSRPEPFWHAWTLMLEELSARNADAERTGTIRAHIKRLESIDPGLGGEPWRTRIARVRERVSK